MGDRAGGDDTSRESAERKVVTVLAVDVDEPVEGFDERDPEDVRAMLARHVERVRTVVERFGGTVEHVVAGRAVAVFGVPRTREDDPERAVRAALATRDALAGAQGAVRVHLAVASGEALVRLGQDNAGSQRVSGAPVGTCVRLLETVPAGAVMVTEPTARATEAAIAYGPSSSVTLPGGKITSVRPAVDPRPGFGVPARAETPLVGRAAELDALADQLAQVRSARSPRLLVLVGPPGIGKSRLVEELAHAAEQAPEPSAWRRGRSLPYGDGVTFSALSEIVRAEAGILEGDSAKRALSKLTAAAGLSLIHI